VGFVHGLQLSKQFYWQAVRPVLDAHFPGLVHSAALLGAGSEVLGFDTEMSTDHHWGPRLMLFVSKADLARLAQGIHQALAEHLPATFLGYPTNFTPPNPADSGVQLLQPLAAGPVNHRVEVFSIPKFFKDYLGADLSRETSVADWLTFEEQRLLGATAGEVYFDGLGPGALEAARANFSYYPLDVWLYLLAAQWMKISQEEPFVGRCGSVGDETGSRLVAARLVGALMRLCFLMEKRYAPYSKWFGTAFSRLACAGLFQPLFERVWQAATWQERQEALCPAYELAARMHNDLGITPPLPAKVSLFHGRPFWVIHGEAFAEAIRQAIQGEAVRSLPAFVGSVNQFVDSVDVLTNVELRKPLQSVFRIK
jgi:hypothetical protein